MWAVVGVYLNPKRLRYERPAAFTRNHRDPGDGVVRSQYVEPSAGSLNMFGKESESKMRLQINVTRSPTVQESSITP